MNLDFIHKLTQIVLENMHDENFGPEQLVKIAGKSHSTVHRRIKENSGQSISQFMRSTRLKKAKELLVSQEYTIAEIAYKVGFSSPAYFNKCFHDEFGKPPGEFKKEILSEKTPKKYKLLIFIVPALILLIFLLVPSLRSTVWKTNNTAQKTIAVLPFNYHGTEKDEEHLAQSMMLEIMTRLSLIEDLIVISTPLDNPENGIAPNQLAKKLNTNYLLEGNLHVEDKKMKLIVSLVKTKNNELVWSRHFNSSLENILEVESRIAQEVAQQLNAFITPEEKVRLTEIPTLNSEANDFYQLGRAAHMEYWHDNQDLESLDKAENYYQMALKNDSSFAQAFVGLARVAYDKTTWSDIFKDTYLDTVLILADKALRLNNTLSEAYTLRGDFYSAIQSDKAINEYEQALHFNPNNWQAFYGLGNFYLLKNNIKAAENIFEATKRRKGPEYPIMMDKLNFIFILNGLFEEGKEILTQKLTWDNDSVYYFKRLALIEEYNEHFANAVNYAQKARSIDSINLNANQLLAFNYTLLKDYSKATLYNKRVIQITDQMNYKLNNEHHRIGYVFLVNGDTITATKYFQRQLEVDRQLISMGNKEEAFYDLAATYAILGQKEKAYQNLNKLLQQNSILWFLYFYMKNDPLFNTIREEDEYREILSQVKIRTEKKRDQLRNWAQQQELFQPLN
ncbi:helix-turn-helix domain-containing protein [Draconibacterium sp. IB214405]|uniref:helix-turn-helix domain-containing protein n=1 Tax=Draconibacterium sp. IB214405 TaxID=3097352 RepID=UPI002A0BEEA7|nr:helix-turn-helix domain-containing protein [Draconibacterium sp. IB214405]MDX8338654.1 helix-turn-helix domain-containing protein [Draconibacterium sp. IB214405]